MTRSYEQVGVDPKLLPDNPYLLLTPGPLSTSKTVKAVMLRDWCTWDSDYHAVVQVIRSRLLTLAGCGSDHVAVLMPGSGTFSVESVLGSVVPDDGRLLVVANGHYGDRMALIAQYLKIPHVVLNLGEVCRPEAAMVAKALEGDPAITHVALVDCETTTGLLNPTAEIGRVVKERGRVFIVDAMSSFGGIPMNLAKMGVDFMISSANKCLQGVPGIGLVVARREELEKCRGRARSLSLDLYGQWFEMKSKRGKWRFTSPTHVVRALAQALDELEIEGGVAARHDRYRLNQETLVAGMTKLGFECLLPKAWHSSIITAFLNPGHPDYRFEVFYQRLKRKGFVIYPGVVTSANTFRIGNIGQIFPEDIKRLLVAIQECVYWW